MENWYFENQLTGFGYRMKIKENLEKFRSEYQDIEMMETYDYGKLLTLDGLVMVTERDEFFYHDAISHPSLFVHPNPEKVLIIGGGDCGTLREVLKHKNVKEAHLCELDGGVVYVCKRHYSFTQPSLDDKRSKLFIQDGFKFLEDNKNEYDVILVDSTDPIGEAAKLFGENFFDLCFNALKSDGILAGQAGCYLYDTQVPVDVYKILKGKFPIARLYTALTPTYPSGFWSFYYASKKYCMVKDFDKNRVIKSGLDFDYYNEDMHLSFTALPNFFKKALEGKSS